MLYVTFKAPCPRFIPLLITHMCPTSLNAICSFGYSFLYHIDMRILNELFITMYNGLKISNINSLRTMHLQCLNLKPKAVTAAPGRLFRDSTTCPAVASLSAARVSSLSTLCGTPESWPWHIPQEAGGSNENPPTEEALRRLEYFNAAVGERYLKGYKESFLRAPVTSLQK